MTPNPPVDPPRRDPPVVDLRDTPAGDDPAHANHRYASLSVAEVLRLLETDARGLTQAEAARRLARFGANRPPKPARPSWVLRLSKHFTHLFAALLWAAAALAWLTSLPELAYSIVVVILVNGIFSFWQEYRAERALEALTALLPRKATVRRAGKVDRLDAEQVVPGDVLILSEGDAVPADARICSCDGLRLDLSSFTGESRPVPRITDPESGRARGPTHSHNLVFAGTTVTSGRGEAVVFATGSRTEFGRIAALTHGQRERQSPLEAELARVTRVVTLLSFCMGVFFFAMGTWLAGLAPSAGLLFALGIIVANVPEGLMPTLTLSLAIGVRRMASRHALVKRLSSVEALGATTLILTDKTGTLTENEMTVRQVWTDGENYSVSGVGYALAGRIDRRQQPDVAEIPTGDSRPADSLSSAPSSAQPIGSPSERPTPTAALNELLFTAALCCDAHLTRDERDPRRFRVLGDPTEAAILVAASKAGIYPELLGGRPRLAELPFDSSRKRMTTIHDVEGVATACMKGAPSQVLPLCATVREGSCAKPLGVLETQRARAAHEALAKRGYRVLAVARRKLPSREPAALKAEHVEHAMELLGFLAMEDPPRAEVPSALAACHDAHVRVAMVTGDSVLTARAIAEEIGMYRGPARVVNGDELDALDDARLNALLSEPNLLFARVSPEHKLRLVLAYQERGEIVAVTGDGVNDAPALKRADVGVAMGETGTDVAREAADVILTNDDFSNIVVAIREGRAVYANVRKFITYIFSSNVPELVPFVVFVLFGIPLPLTIMQILAVDLGTDLLPALALGAEPPEPHIMKQPPRSRRERLLNAGTLLRAYAFLGTIQAALCLLAYFAAYRMAGLKWGGPWPSSGPIYATATTMSFAGIVACQIGNLFACRSSRTSIFESMPRRDFRPANPLLLGGLAFEVGLLLLLVYVPRLAQAFDLAPLEARHFALLGTFPALLLLSEEVRKAVIRQRRLHSVRSNLA